MIGFRSWLVVRPDEPEASKEANGPSSLCKGVSRAHNLCGLVRVGGLVRLIVNFTYKFKNEIDKQP
jgi:hypothetical protein